MFLDMLYDFSLQWPLDKIKDLAKDSGKIGEHKILILWYFEDLFKEKYSEFVESLEVGRFSSYKLLYLG